MTIAEEREPEGTVDLRVYALTEDQSHQVDAEIAADEDTVYIHESDLPEPEARVPIERNAAAPAAQPC